MASDAAYEATIHRGQGASQLALQFGEGSVLVLYETQRIVRIQRAAVRK